MLGPAVDGCKQADVDELLERARALSGLTVAELAGRVGASLPRDPKREKGYIGRLVERALGAEATRADAITDFPALGVELKTLPVDECGRPRESTFVCHVDLRRIVDHAWEASRVRAKIARVLFVPIESGRTLLFARRRVGRAFLWCPTDAELASLAADYDDLVGRIALGESDRVTGHHGRILQLRPKARDGKARARAADADGVTHDTYPRAFYLRASFTRQLVARAFDSSCGDPSRF